MSGNSPRVAHEIVTYTFRVCERKRRPRGTAAERARSGHACPPLRYNGLVIIRRAQRRVLALWRLT